MTKPFKQLTRSVKLYLILLIISTVGILYGTLFPVDYSVPRSFYGLDKFVHFVMFGAWTFFFGIVRFLKGNFKLMTIFMGGSAFGVLIEVLQHLLPTGRSPELLDLVADITGTAAAVIILYILSKTVTQFSPTPHDNAI
ncbi:VanZ family protein [Gracilimonas sp. Q87]|uniref:VanZ family protein n=1 Tax=Gracilimonas sp. Q87 TaxID=3384766 RepID=UPI003983EF6D